MPRGRPAVTSAPHLVAPRLERRAWIEASTLPRSSQIAHRRPSSAAAIVTGPLPSLARDDRGVARADPPHADLVLGLGRRIGDVDAAARRARPAACGRCIPIVIAPVPGIVTRAPTGSPAAPTCCACTPSCDASLEYHAIMVRPRGVRDQVRVVAVLLARHVVVVGRRGREAGVDPRAERPGPGLQRACRPRARSRRSGSRRTGRRSGSPGRAAAPSSSRRRADSAVLISRCGSLVSVVRKPPQNTRRPPGSTTSAGFVNPVQPLWIGFVAPIRPLPRDDGVQQVLRVRPGRVVPGEVQRPRRRSGRTRPGRCSTRPWSSPASTARRRGRRRRPRGEHGGEHGGAELHRPTLPACRTEDRQIAAPARGGRRDAARLARAVEQPGVAHALRLAGGELRVAGVVRVVHVVVDRVEARAPSRCPCPPGSPRSASSPPACRRRSRPWRCSRRRTCARGSASGRPRASPVSPWSYRPAYVVEVPGIDSQSTTTPSR